MPGRRGHVARLSRGRAADQPGFARRRRLDPSDAPSSPPRSPAGERNDRARLATNSREIPRACHPDCGAAARSSRLRGRRTRLDARGLSRGPGAALRRFASAIQSCRRRGAGDPDRLRPGSRRSPRLCALPLHARPICSQHVLWRMRCRLAAVRDHEAPAHRRSWSAQCLTRHDPARGRPPSGHLRGSPPLLLRRGHAGGRGLVPGRRRVRRNLVRRGLARERNPMTVGGIRHANAL